MAQVCLIVDSRFIGFPDGRVPADSRPVRERPDNPEFFGIPECGRQTGGRQDDRLLLLCVCAEELCYDTRDWNECLVCRNTCNAVTFQLSFNRIYWEYVTQAGQGCYDLRQDLEPIDCFSCKIGRYVCPYGCPLENENSGFDIPGDKRIN